MLRFSATLSAILSAILSAMVTSAVAMAGTALPVMKVLIAPGPMDQQTNHADVKVTVTISRVEPRTPSFKLPAFPDLVVSDAKGTVSAAGPEGARAWKASRAVSGELVIRYRVPVENTLTNGGIPPLGPRIDGKGFSAAGQTFLAILQSKSPYRILIRWDLSAMGPGATATSSFGDGDVELPAGPASGSRSLPSWPVNSTVSLRSSSPTASRPRGRATPGSICTR